MELIFPIQADVFVEFEIEGLEKAEPFDHSWTDPQILCSHKGADVEGGIGPFGLKALASSGLEEYTAVFFRVFKAHEDDFVVLMCSDQSRFGFCLLLRLISLSEWVFFPHIDALLLKAVHAIS